MDNQTTFPLATIAKMLDLTPRRIHQLVNDGVIPREERGRYALVPVVQGYIKFLRDRAINADVGANELGLHRARKLKAEADALEIDIGLKRKEVIPAADFHHMVTSAFARVRAKFLALPSKLAPSMAVEITTGEAEKVLRTAVYEALQELADTEINDDGMPVDAGAVGDG